MTASETAWWRDAVIYQVYIRSFADGNGDGEGDIAGIRRRLPYLRDLGVDAVWINPWYPSPLIDGGDTHTVTAAGRSELVRTGRLVRTRPSLTWANTTRRPDNSECRDLSD